jgi:hypothetical protein
MGHKLVKKYGSKDYIVKKYNRKGEYLICKSCGNEFYVTPSYIKKALLNNNNIQYCSMKCYDKSGENNPFYGKTFSKESLEKLINNPNRSKFKSGKQNPNYSKYNEYYKGISFQWWREFLKETIGECELCKYSDKRALQLHHKDKNRKNNTRNNLILLCANCHCIEHYKDKSGIYSNLIYDKYEKENY